jgi:hypothetical protein
MLRRNEKKKLISFLSIQIKLCKHTLTSDGGVAVKALEVILFPLVDGVDVIGKSSVAFARASLLRSNIDNNDLTTQSRVGP